MFLMATKSMLIGIEGDPGVLWVLAGTLAGAESPVKGASYRVARFRFKLIVAASKTFVAFASIDDYKYTSALI